MLSTLSSGDEEQDSRSSPASPIPEVEVERYMALARTPADMGKVHTVVGLLVLQSGCLPVTLLLRSQDQSSPWPPRTVRAERAAMIVSVHPGQPE